MEFLKYFPDLSENSLIVIVLLMGLFGYLRDERQAKKNAENSDRIADMSKGLERLTVTLTEFISAQSKSIVNSQVGELHQWHNVRDSDGVPVWYVRRDFIGSISRLTEIVARQNSFLENLLQRKENSHRETMKEIEAIKRQIEGMKR